MFTARVGGSTAAAAAPSSMCRQAGEPRLARIDDDQARAALPCPLDGRAEMDARSGRIAAPDHDEAGMLVVRQRDARHLAVKTGGRGPGGRRAYRAQETR